MKMIGVLAVAVLTVIGSFTAQAQGPLNPSGPPGETMKTLDQVEPRLPIPGGTDAFTITREGSYYLTSNLYDRLTISASNVTVDLMGFMIRVSSGDAIDISGKARNLTIRNGIINGSPNSHGVDGRYLRGSNSRFEDLQISGCGYAGMYIGSDCLIQNCLLISNGQYGVRSSSSGGLEVRNCRILGSAEVGLYAEEDSRIVDNVIERNGTVGLRLVGSGSYVAGNSVQGNADNYDFAAGNQLNLLLCEIPETLDWPCSVKLAGTLTCSVSDTNGITVNADNVTIDMAGHTLIGPGEGSKSGIYQSSAYRNLHVLNGKATQWRGAPQAGFYLNGQSGILTDLQASSNYYGIAAGYGSAMARCTASHNGEDGIFAQADCTLAQCAAYDNNDDGIYASAGCSLDNCAARDNGDNGINAYSGCTLANCAAYDNSDDGIVADYGCSLVNCAARYNGDNGIKAYNGCSLDHCAASYNSSKGVYAAYDNHVSGCTCDGNGSEGNGAGIYANGTDNRIEGNTCTDNDRGIHVTATGNFIVRNTCSGNTTNWVIAANNKVGEIVSAPNSGAISGDTGGAGVGSTDPWANFTY